MANLQTQAELEKLVKRYRKRLGVDPVWVIHVKVVQDDKVKKTDKNCDAWIEDEESHPIAKMSIRQAALFRLKNYPRLITRLIVHELLHLVIGDAFKDLKKNYDYDKDGMIEEALVMRLAKAVVPATNNEKYDSID